MNLLSNRTAIRKVELALGDLTSGIGFLKPAPARKFLELIISQAVLMKEVTVRPMASPREPISTIGFGDRVLRPAHEGKALTPDDRSKAFNMGVLNGAIYLFKS